MAFPIPPSEFSDSPADAMTSNLLNPCLSVIMPVYNERQTLGEIIEAVLKQNTSASVRA